MRQVIPFSKNIEFNSMISEITNISLEHDLALKDDHNINGDFFITGKYKINASSPQEEDFSYKIPIDITIDQKYKTDNIELEIDDFKYETIESNKLKVDIDLSIDNLEKQEEIVEEIETLEFDDNDSVEERKVLTDEEKEDIDNIINSDDTTDLFQETSVKEEVVIPNQELVSQEDMTLNQEKIDKNDKSDKKDKNDNSDETKTSVGSLFTAFKDTEETFSTYSVYIVRNGDNIEDVMDKYKTNREILSEYNDMSNIKIGTKLIIPSTKDENDK